MYDNLNKKELAEVISIARLLKHTYPTGIVSIVADTFDFWALMTKMLPILKPIIESRQPNALGLCKVVFRPDSGNPVDIICGVSGPWNEGQEDYNTASDIEFGPEEKGAIECLHDTFGGIINYQGYIELNPKVGLIYGDSITLERQDTILSRLMDKGFASSNIVLGIGSYTYQYNTRDTFGFAMKATYSEVNNIGIDICKDPATDNGTKKSAKGLLRVDSINGRFILHDQVTKEQEYGGELQTVFKNGVLMVDTSLAEIRSKLRDN